ncbi:MAG TPA: hypothetical protein VMB49_21440 [Acidobacteriaceae bacterium]|nr:hypothetical protein [Acidobacteriaceae bacterium]
MTSYIGRTLSSAALLLFLLPNQPLFSQPSSWVPVGPDGGDGRSFAADPSNDKHLYLGTTNSWIYESEDGGASWQRLAKLAKTDDLTLDNIVVDSADPKTLLVGAWVLDHPDGGLFISHDAGKTWTEVDGMKGQSIRALAQAPSDPKIFIVGTLRGVYRSEDGGVHWNQISPVGSMDIHEVESIAIDPKDPKIIYAGTWHLPWKTTDGGANWHNIKQGLIDDSDVFSIIIDPTVPNVVYTSACSGIYRSDTSGELYRKIQGIPSTARRTRVLMLDPSNRNTVYAGTTEGLYKTLDGGTEWKRMTGPDVIVNDVYVDPKNSQHVLLATDRSGVLESDDAGASFKASNTGFTQRQVATILVDTKSPQTILAGVVNDKIYGGVFVSHDDGATWTQQSNGLQGRDVFDLSESDGGVILAGTNSGIFRWDGTTWQQDGKIVKPEKKTKYVIHKGRRAKEETTVMVPDGQIEVKVHDVDASGSVWYAATANGVYASKDQGATWVGGPVLGKAEYRAVAASGSTVIAAQRTALAWSEDGGTTWQSMPMPQKLTWMQSITLAGNGSLWVGGREGVFYTDDRGQSWKDVSNLPISDISGLSYDPGLKRVLATSWNSSWLLAIDPSDRTFKFYDPGWRVRHVRSLDGRLLAASPYNGVVMEPKNAASKVTVAQTP